MEETRITMKGQENKSPQILDGYRAALTGGNSPKTRGRLAHHFQKAKRYLVPFGLALRHSRLRFACG